MMKEALDWTVEGINLQHAQALLHDKSSYAWARMDSGLCMLHESVKANPLNLSIIWDMLKGDVLTFLDLHSQTWRWIMYCMQMDP